MKTYEESTGVDDKRTGVSQLSYQAINATTPLPFKIRAVLFFDRTLF